MTPQVKEATFKFSQLKSLILVSENVMQNKIYQAITKNVFYCNKIHLYRNQIKSLILIAILHF